MVTCAVGAHAEGPDLLLRIQALLRFGADRGGSAAPTPTSTWHTGALPLWAVPPPLTFPASPGLGKADLVTCPSCHCAPGHMGTLTGTRASHTSLPVTSAGQELSPQFRV